MMDMCHFRLEIYVNQLPCKAMFNMFVYSKQEAINIFFLIAAFQLVREMSKLHFTELQ